MAVLRPAVAGTCRCALGADRNLYAADNAAARNYKRREKAMRSTMKCRVALAATVLAWSLGAGAALAQVEQAHLRIDGMT